MASTGSPMVEPMSTPQCPSWHSGGRVTGRAAPKRREANSGSARLGPMSGWYQTGRAGSGGGGASPSWCAAGAGKTATASAGSGSNCSR
jgi:hypothetical protein